MPRKALAKGKLGMFMKSFAQLCRSSRRVGRASVGRHQVFIGIDEVSGMNGSQQGSRYYRESAK